MTTLASSASTDETSTSIYAVKDMDHLGLVAGMIDELGLVKLIDTLIPQDHEQRHVSIGLAVKAMILNGLGFIQRVLYMMPRFFQNKPLERLLGPGICAEHLNDDMLGRALDAIFRYGPSRLYAQVAAQAVNRLGLECKTGHLDSTSIHVDGDYNSEKPPEEGIIHVTKGYSRDHRQDLNQVVVQFICENQTGIPLLMNSLSGNSSDQTSFRETISAHIDQLKTNIGLQYIVADSALYVEKTLQELNNFHWISRVPETISLAVNLTLAVAGELAQNGEGIAYRVIYTTYGGIRQRWLVVYTQAAQRRAQQTLEKQHSKQGNADLKAFKQLQKIAFACEEDAQTALQAFNQKLTLTTVCDGEIIKCARYTKKGRPSENQEPDFYQYFIGGALASVVAVHQQQLQRKSCFIVATNELDDQALSHDEVLELYKKDQQKVERGFQEALVCPLRGGFRFLKDPLFMASTLFIKSVTRLMALMMIMTLCLLVYAAIEYRIRQALKQKQQTFPNQKWQPIENPTARWVFQFFSGIRLLIISHTQEIVLNMNEHHRCLLALMGNHYAELYAGSA
jgi:transposase